MKARRALLLGVVLLAFGLRVTQLGEQGLWLDEAISYFRASSLLGDPLPGFVPRYQARHMLWDVLLSPWATLIPQEMGLRWLSALAGVLSVPLAYRVGRAAASERVGLLAALLIAISPAQLHYSQEGRQYALVLALSLLALWLLLERKALPFALVTALLPALHAISAVWAATLALYALGWGWRSGRRDLLHAGAGALAGAVTIAGVIYALESGSPFLQWMTPPPLTMLFSILSLGLNYLTPIGPEPGTLFAAAAYQLGRLLLAAYLIVLLARREVPKLLIAVLAGGPPLVLMAVSHLVQPIIAQRYLVASIGAVTITLALALDWLLEQRLTGRVLGGVLLALVIATSALLDVRTHTDPAFSRGDWRSALAAVSVGEPLVMEEALIGEYYRAVYGFELTLVEEPPAAAPCLWAVGRDRYLAEVQGRAEGVYEVGASHDFGGVGVLRLDRLPSGRDNGCETTGRDISP